MKKGDSKPILIANWKMHLDHAASQALFDELEGRITDEIASRVDIVICPSFTSLFDLKNRKSKKFSLGAQNLFWEASGSFTGEVSSLMLKDLVEYVLVGHSERRKFLGETDDIAAKKVKMALESGLVPVLLVGESLATRKRGQTNIFIEKQLEKALKDVVLKDDERLIVAYEPIWAVGPETPAAEPSQVEEAVGIIRKKLSQLLGEKGNTVPIIYGGSSDSSNILSFYDLDEVSGAVVGHASLDADDFSQMAQKIAYYIN